MPNLRKPEHLPDIFNIVLCYVGDIAQFEAPVFYFVNPFLPYGVNLNHHGGSHRVYAGVYLHFGPVYELQYSVSCVFRTIIHLCSGGYAGIIIISIIATIKNAAIFYTVAYIKAFVLISVIVRVNIIKIIIRYYRRTFQSLSPCTCLFTVSIWA